MGTQFWWFYDVLVLSVFAGVMYAAVSRGFNKGVFRLIGFLLAIVAGIYGSDALKNMVYESVFQQKIVNTVSVALENEEWNVFENAADALALSSADDAEMPDAEAFQKAHADLLAQKTDAYPEWFAEPVCSVTEYTVSAAQKPHSRQSLAALYAEDASGLYTLVELLRNKNAQEASVLLEERLYRPSYVRMIRMALFLLIQLVILIICGIISSMAGSLEEQMHIQRGNHLLGILVGLAEAAGILLMMIAAVRLIVAITDGQMLLFNQETIGETKIFRYMYDL